MVKQEWRTLGVSCCRWFEYGTSTAYESSFACSALPGSGSSPVAVSAILTTDLAANTEYHFRTLVTNASGTNQGANATFKTS
jgi:hypothetical protein